VLAFVRVLKLKIIMYITEKDLDTISELSAYVDGALESADGFDENGLNIQDYWLDLDKRVELLQNKMKKQFHRQKSYLKNNS
jgi:hypothetical protein